ncbi:MAG: DUF3343 domain-containing protein [Oscillospiraceae bacterium]|nr:DUF3343 domain-containing protein [Oscillospiraceae bacterium]
MLYYLIVCRSLTYAQCTAAALERAGITAHILRSPKSIAGEGCSHSVKLSQRRLADALRVLHRVGLEPKRIFITSGDGSYREVEL